MSCISTSTTLLWKFMQQLIFQRYIYAKHTFDIKRSTINTLIVTSNYGRFHKLKDYYASNNFVSGVFLFLGGLFTGVQHQRHCSIDTERSFGKWRPLLWPLYFHFLLCTVINRDNTPANASYYKLHSVSCLAGARFISVGTASGTNEMKTKLNHCESNIRKRKNFGP